jgi:hypothetical protein
MHIYPKIWPHPYVTFDTCRFSLSRLGVCTPGHSAEAPAEDSQDQQSS